MKLRKYQEKIISKLRKSITENNKKIILCAPTGSGKTIMFTFMVKNHLDRGGKILIFTHRKELLKQSGGAFNKFGIEPTYIEAGKYPSLNDNLHVSMIETFCRRIDKYADFLKSRTMIIFDEAHLENFTKLFSYIDKNTFVIGATATPLRKGNQNALSEFYTDIVQDIDTPDLIELGFLAKPFSYGVKIDLKGMKKKGDEYDTANYYEKNKIYKGVVENYIRLAENEKTIVFTSNVASSIQVCNEFVKQGYNAKHIDANTKNRDDIFDWFDKNNDAILCNCGIATTGFDQPDIKCVILYMATTSEIKMLQCVGRGGRVTETKDSFKILDFGNNILRMGFWENRREWSLNKKEKKQGIAPVKICPSCAAMIPAPVMTCSYCGYEFKLSEKEEKEKRFAELKLLTRGQGMNLAKMSGLQDKVDLCKAKVISPFWVLHQMTEIEEAKQFIKMMGYKQGFIFLNKDKFKVFQDER